jgi:hypothetical protein
LKDAFVHVMHKAEHGFGEIGTFAVESGRRTRMIIIAA